MGLLRASFWSCVVFLGWNRGGAWGYLSDADFTSKHGAVCSTKSGHNMDMVVFNGIQPSPEISEWEMSNISN